MDKKRVKELMEWHLQVARYVGPKTRKIYEDTAAALRRTYLDAPSRPDCQTLGAGNKAARKKAID